MNLRIYGPDGFIMNLRVWSWDVAQVLADIQATFKGAVIDLRFGTIELP